MERKKSATVGLFSVILLVAAIGAAFTFAPAAAPISDGLKEHGLICAQVTRADGTVEPAICNHNLITNYGKDMIKMDMMGTAQVQIDNLAVGNSTTLAVTDTSLPGQHAVCGFTQTAGTLASVGIGNWSLMYQWTSTCNNWNVNSTAIYNTTNATGIFAEAAWSPTTVLQNGDKLNVTYYTWVS